MSSRSFSGSGPRIPHLVLGAGGVASEIADLRSDAEEAFADIEAEIDAVIPAIQGAIDRDELLVYLGRIHRAAAKAGFGLGSYTHGATVESNGYVGSVYSPTQNRIYFVPSRQAAEPQWHYLDCETGKVVAYTHGVGVLGISAYSGGVYSPTQNRIYFVPTKQGPEPQWHYIDCATGAVVAYTHEADVVDQGYHGGCYSPTQNRIYLAPAGQATEDEWHYIDCSTGDVVAYEHGAVASVYAYLGMTYSPTQNRIYLSPTGQGPDSTWHYIDCATGLVVPYTHNSTTTLHTYSYKSGVYSPIQDRIYFMPYGQCEYPVWHYIDCETGEVVEYEHGMGPLVEYAYEEGAYMPALDRIYLAPYEHAATDPVWHYIDCETELVVEYPGVLAISGAYAGCAYSPTQNRIYFSPNVQTVEDTWHYIQEYSDIPVSRSLMAGALFNKL